MNFKRVMSLALTICMMASCIAQPVWAEEVQEPLPTEVLTETVTAAPTEIPTTAPTEVPAENPAEEPTEVPTEIPTQDSSETAIDASTEETSAIPTEVPTEIPVEVSTDVPTEEVAEEPTAAPTEEATEEPTAEPTEEVTEEPTAEPTEEATEEPTTAPTEEATEEPTAEPTEEVTEEPTAEPTQEVTEEPTAEPTQEVTEEPTAEPTEEVTEEPTAVPTEEVTEEPTAEPAEEVTEEPTVVPTEEVTDEPTAAPTEEVTEESTAEPTEEVPAEEPTPDPDATEIPDEPEAQPVISLEIAGEALVRCDVPFTVTAVGADSFVLEVYAESGEQLLREEMPLTDGTATFTRRVDAPCTERIVVSFLAGEQVIAAETTVAYAALGELSAPEMLSTAEFASGMPFTVEWTPVEGAQGYHIAWIKPDGSAFSFDTAEPSLPLTEADTDQIGEYRLTLCAFCAGYTAAPLDAVLQGMDGIMLLSNEADFEVSEDGTLTKYLGAGGDVIVPEGVKQIASGVFNNNSSITSIYLPDGVISIGNATFEYCVNLQSIRLPESLMNIGKRAFAHCSSIASISLPNGITSISDEMFISCSNLSDVHWPSSLTNIGSSAFQRCSSLKKVTLPNGLTSIGSSAFDECSNLSDVYLPEGILSIGSSSFYSCSNLKSISIPSSVKNIGNWAFRYCSNLTNVHLVYGLESIGTFVFAGCKSLEFIELPNSITKIGSGAFSDCTSLRSINMPEGITSVSQELFSACLNLSDVKLPNSITTIEPRAFEGCQSLTSIDLPDQLISIGMWAFSSCSLTSIRFPLPFEMLGISAFSGTNLVHIEMYDLVTDILFEAIPRNKDQFFTLYVRNMEDIFYPEQYCIDNEIPYEKVLYCTTEPTIPPTTPPPLSSELLFQMDRNDILPGESVQFIVFANGASQVQLIVDGEYYDTYEVIDGTAIGTRAFTQSGTRQVAFRALYDDVWSEPCAAQTLTVNSAGQLEAPVITAATPQEYANGLTFSWNSIEHAEGYTYHVLTASGEVCVETVLSDGSAQYTVTVPPEKLAGVGEYTIFVMAYGTGYDQSESAAVTVQIKEQEETYPFYFIMDRNEITAGESVQFTVIVTEGYSRPDDLSLLINGEYSGSYGLGYEPEIINYTFDQPGVYQISFQGRYQVPVYPDDYVTCPEQTLIVKEKENKLSFTMDHSTITAGETVTFTVTAPDATQVQLIVDGEYYDIYEAVEGTAIGTRAFTQAGVRQVAFRALYDDVWSESCATQTLTVNSAGQLEAPVVTAATPQEYVNGLTFSWNGMEHAEGFTYHVLTASGEVCSETVPSDGNTQYTVTVPPEKLAGVGEYTIFVMAYGTGYDQSESAAVNVTLTETATPTPEPTATPEPERTLSFVMSSSTITAGETVTFTVTVPGASQVQLAVDGNFYDGPLPLTDGKCIFTRTFTQAGGRQVAFRALYDGEWSGLCTAQTLTVLSKGKLDAVVVSVGAQHMLGQAVPLSWTAVEHATAYNVYVYDATGNVLFKQESVTETAFTVPASAFPGVGSYTLTVMAFGTGYDQSEGSGVTEIISQLSGPVILTPEADAVLPDQSVLLTWEAETGATGYVVTLARKTGAVDEYGQPVYEKVWSPDTVNVGNVTSYALDGLVYGTEYRVAVGTLNPWNEGIGWSTRTFAVQAPKPGQLTVTAQPNPAWVDTDVIFNVTGDANTNTVDVYQGDAFLATVPFATELSDETKHIFHYIGRFSEAGEYTLHFTPVNAQGEWSEPAYLTMTVIEKGKVPDLTINNLKNGDILTQNGYIVHWDPALVSPDMDFGGYCVILSKLENEEWQLVPGAVYQPTGTETAYALPMLEAGGQYQLEVYTLEQGNAEPVPERSGHTAVQFTYRTVPAFTQRIEEKEGEIGASITVSWEAPVWPLDPTLKPDKYVVWWYGPGLPYNEAMQTNALAMDESGDATSATLDGQYTMAGGTYTVNVYALLLTDGHEEWCMATGDDAVEIATPEVNITMPNPNQNTYLVTDSIDVSGTVKGGIRFVLARVMTNSAPIDLQGGIKYVIVPVENGNFWIRLTPAENMTPSEGDQTNYAVEVYGFMQESDIAVTANDQVNGFVANNFCMVNIDDGEIRSLSLTRDTRSYAFTDEEIRLKAVTNGAIQQISFTRDGGKGLGTDTKGDMHANATVDFYSNTFTLETEGEHRVTASAPSGKSTTKTLYAVTRVAPYKMYFNFEGTPLKVHWLPYVQNSYYVQQLEASVEATVVGKYGNWLLIDANGKRGFVQANELMYNLRTSAWSVTIESNRYLVVQNNTEAKLPDRDKYVLIVREKMNPANVFVFNQAQLLISSDQYNNYFRKYNIAVDLIQLRAGIDYEAAIVPSKLINNPAAREFLNEFKFGEQKGILEPSPDSNVVFWDTRELTIKWVLEPGVNNYQFELALFIDGKYVPVYNTRVSAAESSIDGTTGILTISLEDVEMGKIPERVFSNKTQARITMLPD